MKEYSIFLEICSKSLSLHSLIDIFGDCAASSINKGEVSDLITDPAPWPYSSWRIDVPDSVDSSDLNAQLRYLLAHPAVTGLQASKQRVPGDATCNINIGVMSDSYVTVFSIQSSNVHAMRLIDCNLIISFYPTDFSSQDGL